MESPLVAARGPSFREAMMKGATNGSFLGDRTDLHPDCDSGYTHLHLC
jgi:hypothetical protein